MRLLRLIVLWIALIVLFVAFYVFYSGGGQSTDLLDVLRMGGGWFAFALLGVFVTIVAVFVAVAFGGARTHNEGVALLTEGRHTQALEKFERALPALRRNPLIHMNIGSVHHNLWQLEKAEESLLRATKMMLSSHVKMLALPLLALNQALLGKAIEARAVLEKVREAGHDASPVALLAQAVLFCRERQWAEAQTVLARHELRNLGGVSRSLADALRAWSAENTTGQKRHVDVVGVFGETGPDRLQLYWPELAQYLDTALRV
jgi:tetratricopeptide (TPR) repeat protein